MDLMKAESSKNEIRNAFISYVTHATSTLSPRGHRRGQIVEDPVKLAYIAPVHRLRSLVEKLESSPSFEKLSLALDESGFNPYRTRGVLQTFFRRSHFYLELHDSHKPDPDHFFELFWSSLASPTTKTTRLSLLADVGFESKVLDFGLFIIRKFTTAELDKLVDNRMREIFYPGSKIDTLMVSRFWFIVEDTAIAQRSDDAIQRGFPERSIHLLSLYPWPHVELRNFTGLWNKFRVPFSFAFDDDILSPPSWIDIPTSVKEDFQEMMEDELMLAEWKKEFPDEDTPGWYPPPEYHFKVELNRQEELSLKNIVSKGEKILKIIELAEEWSFVEIAIGYLAKALITPEGLDQILWHVAVLEALLSEENAGVRQTMLRRMANILAATKAEKKQVRKRFDDMYDFRSQLVHGKKYTQKAQWSNLNDARELAREVLLWFIDYLLRVDQRLRKKNIHYEHYPRRDELLTVLDFDIGLCGD